MDDSSIVRVKPKLRGVFHEAGFYAALAAGAAMVVTAEPGRSRAAALIFSSCVAVCFGASALYHRPTWTPRVRGWLARLDHAGIYLLIAGTYTPPGLIVMSGAWRTTILAIVWSGAAIAILMKLFWLRVPKRMSAAIALLLGWVAIAVLPQLVKIGPAG